MTGLILVAWREIADRRIFVVAGLILGALPFALQATVLDREGRGLVAVGVATLCALVTGLVTGASVIGRDLGEGRTSFFFTKPLAWWAIWAGKLLGAVCLTITVALLAVLPALGAPTAFSTWRSLMSHSWVTGGSADWLFVPAGPLIVLCWSFLLVGLGNAASVVYRSRSAWAALDIVALLGFLVALGHVLPDLERQAAVHGERLQLLVLVGPTCALVFASAVQSALGRADLRRSHILLSLALWPCIVPWTLVLLKQASLLRFAPTGTPREIVAAIGAPRGNWVMVSNGFKGGEWFLADTRTGRVAWFLGTFWGPRVFSANGRYAAWPAEIGSRDVLAIVALDGDSPPAVKLKLPQDATWFALSPDGQAALAGVQARDRHEVTVHDVPSGRRLFLVPSDGAVVAQAGFLDSGRVRAFRGRGDWFEVLDVEVPSGRTDVVGRVDAPGHAWARAGAAEHWPYGVYGGFRLDSTGDRMVLVEALGRYGESSRVTLRNGKTGALVALLLAAATNTNSIHVAFSPVGIVVLDADVRQLSMFSDEGALKWQMAQIDCIGGEPQPGRLVVCGAGGAILVDTNDGRVLRREQDLWPIEVADDFDRPRDPVARSVVGSEGARLFLDRNAGRLVELNPDTGARRVVLPRE
jgi:hypothetical protein